MWDMQLDEFFCHFCIACSFFHFPGVHQTFNQVPLTERGERNETNTENILLRERADTTGESTLMDNIVLYTVVFARIAVLHPRIPPS